MNVCELESQLESLHLEGCNYDVYYRDNAGKLNSIDLVTISSNSENIILE